MFEFLYKSEYIIARSKEDYYHFGFVNVPPPTWSTVLNCFDTTLNVYLKNENTNEKKTNVVFNSLNNYGFVFNFPLSDAKEVRIFTDFLKAISLSNQTHRKKQIFSALNFLSLSSISETLPRHNDVMDVWCWQVLGNTHMIVEGKNRVFDKVLEPGELIYIPRGMYHITKSMGPRCIISFGSEDLGEKNGFV